MASHAACMYSGKERLFTDIIDRAHHLGCTAINLRLTLIIDGTARIGYNLNPFNNLYIGLSTGNGFYPYILAYQLTCIDFGFG